MLTRSKVTLGIFVVTVIVLIVVAFWMGRSMNLSASTSAPTMPPATNSGSPAATAPAANGGGPVTPSILTGTVQPTISVTPPVITSPHKSHW
ncbi:hypothetical protein [Dictyobacter aurantiacus]|uniref:Uncharacterized protein n=1 Tax=Dictyobacter aurantiacus TaxID=1936993 RepID=A0A401ZFP5_9CHLR|nr:hypothetical protein [Dictyobacter aurantiacus]GCE05695.1 hypothetical protein KDAU_30240 [Dictyobacter aurantiacus]